MKKQYIFEIKAPIERVFDCFDDKSMVDQWMGGELKTEIKGRSGLSTRDNPVGMKFRHTISGLFESEGEIIAYKKPYLLGAGHQAAGLKGTLFYHLRPLGEGSTELVCDLHVFEGTSLSKVLVTLTKPLLDTVITRHLLYVKEMAEGLKRN